MPHDTPEGKVGWLGEFAVRLVALLLMFAVHYAVMALLSFRIAVLVALAGLSAQLTASGTIDR